MLSEIIRNRLDSFLDCIRYWCKLLWMRQNRFPRQCYLMLKSFDDAGRTRWATKVKQLFLNMVKVWFGYYTMIVIVIRLSRRLG